MYHCQKGRKSTCVWTTKLRGAFIPRLKRCRRFAVVLLSPTNPPSCPVPTETRRERELRGCGPEQAVPPHQDTIPALRTPGLEPQRVDGPQSGGVRMLLQ